MASVELNLHTQPSAEYLGPHGCTRVHRNEKGIDICQYFWPTAPGVTPKGILLIAHGHGGYLQFEYLKAQGSGRLSVYDGSFVAQLNAAGYSVCGNDHRGCGRSSGLRSYCNSFDDYVNDLLTTARSCTTLSLPGFPSGVPLFVMGTSKGGCVVLLSVLREPALFSGVICLAPMVSLEKVAKRGLNPYLRPLGGVLSWLVPTMPLLTVNRNTRYPDLQEVYDCDPNCYHDKTRVRNAQEYLRATELLGAQQSALTLPLLLFHADGDTQTDPEGTLRLYEAAKSADKTLVAPPGMWHILLKEPGHEQVKSKIQEWLDERCGPAAAAVAFGEQGNGVGDAA